jgi:predicted porin
MGYAHAQSNVTLYGVADVGVVYTSNVRTSGGGRSLWQMASGNQSGSRWGVFGSEDLGGGNKAIFRLENGYNLNNGTFGQGGRMFGRQAYVGFTNDNYGTFTMGRQYNAIQDYVAPLDAASTLTQFATHPFDNDNLNNTFRTDNTVKYATPALAGFRAEALYGFSNSTNFATNRAYSVGASYSTGPFSFGTGYVHAQQPGAVGGAIVGTPGGTPSNPLLGATRFDQWGVSGNYSLGAATFGLLYTGSLYTNSTLALTAAGGTIHFHNYEGTIRYYFTPSLVVALAETYTDVYQGGGSGHYLQTSLGADYFLSKRTDVYLAAFYQKSSSNLHATIDAAGGQASGTSQTVAVIGIRHKF